MAAQTTGSIEIEASPEVVMKVIADVEAYPEWAGVRSAEVRGRDDEGRATEAAFEVAGGGFDASYTLAYEYAPDAGGVSWTSTEAGGAVRAVEGGYDLAPSNDGTRVTYRMTVETSMPLPGFLKRQAEKRIVKTALEGLKRRVEGG